MKSAVATNGVVSAHFQLFAADQHAELRWRLLSGNNRELGRSNDYFPDTEACLLAVKQMSRALDDMKAHVRRSDVNSWRWVLNFGVDAVVIGPHAFDRQVRCIQSAEQFRIHARRALPRGAVMVTGARRWANPSIERVPLRIHGSHRAGNGMSVS